jgi:hypothetical protein
MQRAFFRTSILVGALAALAASPSPFAGRWDLTVTTPQGPYPSWLEFAEEAGNPAVRMVGRTGSVHAVRDPKVQDSHLTFVDSDGPWDLDVNNRKLTGHSPGGNVTGVPAPQLNRKTPDAWTAPEPLFNGRDLTGWQALPGAVDHWIVRDGELVNRTVGANLRTLRSFDDFKLHIEYSCQPGCNSGIYLRGRYEIQIEYEPPQKNDAFHGMGSIYGFIPPAAEVAARTGQWESYDVTLVGRTVNVIRDGILIIDHAEIPGITGGALDSDEGAPGPFYLQGDHSGGLRFRNITISVPR